MVKEIFPGEEIEKCKVLRLDHMVIDYLDNFPNLKKFIILKGTNLILTESFGDLTNLEELYIYAPDSIIIPDSFGNLINLKKLKIELSGFTGSIMLPNSFRNLTKLESLKLGGHVCNKNDIFFYEYDMFPENLKELMMTDFTCSDLRDFTENLNLEKLCIYFPYVDTFPESIENFRNLRELNISYNEELKNIPNSIKNLKKLQLLDISGCKFSISELPNSIKKRKNIRISY
ncbi:L domain-like protein [Anaeromyces robustus]|uniref:L domain-like protein n=1 Tax=Anaeromyces robustus TaxID=1754192 RepID=A0A1Y1XPG9_9FUNG|nr:L domain-like protein [Anaeromyces robustus]|eukprot:ORX87649.1 L domain-like protein [Anaeromyces robustus]